jgi:hypothetical protein
VQDIDQLIQTSVNLTDIREGLIGAIPCDPPEARNELCGMSFSDLLAVYIGWIDRFIEPRPREVRAWDGFYTASALSRANEINTIAGLFERGEDLVPYLSPQVHVSGYAPYSKTRSGLVVGGKDRALNAYGVHHLHLVPGNQKGKRKSESQALLFAKVWLDHVLFVMLGDHGSFDDGTLRQAVSDLEVASGNHIRGISEVPREVDAREGEALARQAINAFTPSNGLYAVPGFLSSALTSIKHRIHADKILDVIQQWEPLLRVEAGRRQICEKFSLPFSETSRFGWALHYTTLYLVEEQSKGVVFHLPYQNR